jgi:hypothetical protein
LGWSLERFLTTGKHNFEGFDSKRYVTLSKDEEVGHAKTTFSFSHRDFVAISTIRVAAI